MKTLEQIQEENRKAIILANNPEAKDYEVALDMELDVGGRFDSGESIFFIFRKSMEHVYFSQEGDFWVEKLRPESIKDGNKILGKPLTLDRVLIALGKLDQHVIYAIADSGYLVSINHGHYETFVNNVCYWDLTKPTLEQQTPETQRSINELLN